MDGLRYLVWWLVLHWHHEFLGDVDQSAGTLWAEEVVSLEGGLMWIPSLCRGTMFYFEVDCFDWLWRLVMFIYQRTLFIWLEVCVEWRCLFEDGLSFLWMLVTFTRGRCLRRWGPLHLITFLWWGRMFDLSWITLIRFRCWVRLYLKGLCELRRELLWLVFIASANRGTFLARYYFDVLVMNCISRDVVCLEGNSLDVV